MSTPILMNDFGQFALWAESFRRLDATMICLQKPLDKDRLNSIRYCFVWQPADDFFVDLPSLQIIFSVGAGVDHILGCSSRPRHLPIVRLDDVTLKNEMTEFVVHRVLDQHRQFPLYRQQQQQGLWQAHLQKPANQTTVGVMGLGRLGQAAAQSLVDLNFRVKGWSRSLKQIEGVLCYSETQLNSFLDEVDILVCMLPLTKTTHGLLNQGLLSRLARGAALINVGRGGLQVETDIMAALDGGQLSHAYLDVFCTEPLPRLHPFWAHPNVSLTPHVASQTWPPTAAQHVIDNIKRFEAGLSIGPVYDEARGY